MVIYIQTDPFFFFGRITTSLKRQPQKQETNMKKQKQKESLDIQTDLYIKQQTNK